MAVSREAATANGPRQLLSPLRGLQVYYSQFHGLTPTATGCRRFATIEMRNFKTRQRGALAKTLPSLPSGGVLRWRVGLV